ncbi:MAG: DUF2782 domain-containing protein [Burkholderiales bacterium]
MRFVASVILAVCAGTVLAQAPRPPKFEPIAEPPPLAIGIDNDGAVDRGVRIAPRSNETIEESLPNGKHVVRIRNPNGTEYMLIEDRGDGTYARQIPSDSGVRIPLWILYEF